MQKREAEEGEKPEAVRTHLRDMIIVPEMIGSVIGVYNGKIFNQVEIKVRGPSLRCGRQVTAGMVSTFLINSSGEQMISVT